MLVIMYVLKRAYMHVYLKKWILGYYESREENSPKDMTMWHRMYCSCDETDVGFEYMYVSEKVRPRSIIEMHLKNRGSSIQYRKMII